MRVFERFRDWWRGYSDDDLRSAYEKLANPLCIILPDRVVAWRLTKREMLAAWPGLE